MTTRKLPTVIYKIYSYCNNFIAQLLQKTIKKGPAAFWPGRRQFPATPLQLKKNHNDTLGSGENFLQPDEKIMSLAIIVAE